MKNRSPFFALLFSVVILLSGTVSAQEPDPNFYIYLAFGQSNMEGGGTIAEQDETVNPRFQVYQAVDCFNLGREKGNWYPAIPPLTRCNGGLSPADYFGRTMVEHLPDSIRVGIINVSVAGSKIELFQKTHFSGLSTVEVKTQHFDVGFDAKSIVFCSNVRLCSTSLQYSS